MAKRRSEWTKKDSKARAARRARVDDPGAPTAWGLSRRYRLRPIAVVESGDPGLDRIRDDRARWKLEVAWDGHRVLASRVGDDVRIVSADSREWSAAFPALTMALRKLAVVLRRLLPDLVTIESDIEKRKGRLYLDHLQGFVGKSLVLPYSLRAVDGAPVSMPLDWSEIACGLDPKAFNLKTLRRRLDEKGDMTAALASDERGDLKAAKMRLGVG